MSIKCTIYIRTKLVGRGLALKRGSLAITRGCKFVMHGA